MNLNIIKEYFYNRKNINNEDINHFDICVEYIDDTYLLEYTDKRTSMSFFGRIVIGKEELRNWQINKIINGTNNN